MAALQYLESLRNKHPELADWCDSLRELYQKKLWHQLTLKLEQLVTLPVFQAGDDLIQLYDNFISDFGAEINLLKLSHIAVLVSQQYKEKEAAIKYLQGVTDMIYEVQAAQQDWTDYPFLCIQMQIALLKLQQGDEKACKMLLEYAKLVLDGVTDLDPSVFASFHWVSSQYHKYRGELPEFYRSSLLFLEYVTVEFLPGTLKLDLAYDICLAALFGDNIYNFGELLVHPVIKSVLGTPAEWIYSILEAFNLGDLARWQELSCMHDAYVSAQPASVENGQKLLEKINILGLMEIIFSRPSEDRTIPMSVIANRTELSIEAVEHLLMKSLSVHLIEGIIDQVEGTVFVTWVQPRILGIPQIKLLRDRLDNWIGKVHSAVLLVESETPDLVPAL